MLDSCHSHEHVYNELQMYSPLVTKGNYLVCMDTIVEITDSTPQGERPWGKGNNPMTALHSFLQTPQGKHFKIDTTIDNKLLLSSSPQGYLLRID